MQTNLFKCFLPQAWQFCKPEGVSGFLHPEGVYDDPSGGWFRGKLYQYLKAHFQFDETRRFFHGAESRKAFSINIYRNPSSNIDYGIRFVNISNLFAVKTVLESFESENSLPIPELKC